MSLVPVESPPQEEDKSKQLLVHTAIRATGLGLDYMTTPVIIGSATYYLVHLISPNSNLTRRRAVEFAQELFLIWNFREMVELFNRLVYASASCVINSCKSQSVPQLTDSRETNPQIALPETFVLIEAEGPEVKTYVFTEQELLMLTDEEIDVSDFFVIQETKDDF